MRSMRGGFIFRNQGPSLKVHHGQHGLISRAYMHHRSCVGIYHDAFYAFYASQWWLHFQQSSSPGPSAAEGMLGSSQVSACHCVHRRI
jgi:hypothetical protein